MGPSPTQHALIRSIACGSQVVFRSSTKREVSVLLAIANRDGSRANDFFTGEPAR
jgi:hypothetical protein